MRTLTLVLSLLLASPLTAESVQQQTAELVAMFNKTKHKQKRGTSQYLQVKSEPTRRDVSTLSGTYSAADFGYSISVNIEADGTVTGQGYLQSPFTLRDGRLRGALLTGTKVFADGSTAPLAAVFIERTVRQGTAPDRIERESTELGLGVRTPGLQMDGFTVEKLFFAIEH